MADPEICPSASCFASFFFWIKNIRNLVTLKKISPESVFFYFGGRKRWTKTEWFSYLDKNWKTYTSLNEFLKNDPKGSALNSQLYEAGQAMYKTEIYSRYWKKSGKAVLREKKAMGKLATQLKSMDCVAKIQTEVCLDKKSRVDIKVTMKNGRVVLIEGKHDLSSWTKSHTTDQIARYSRLGKKNFGNKYHRTILCSPKGKYGVSFKEVIEILENIA